MTLWRTDKTDSAMGRAAGVHSFGAAYTKARAWVWGVGASIGNFVAPAAGGAIDGVTANIGSSTTVHGYAATPGYPFAIEAGGAFSAGGNLETLSDGRMVLRSTGRIVMRALEASTGAGDIVWASCRS